MSKSQILRAVEKMKGKHRVILRKLVGQLCPNPADVERELKALCNAL